MTVAMPTRFRCGGCGHEVPWDEPAFACPAARPDDDVDHILVRIAEPGALRFPTPAEMGAEQNPFLRYRTLLHPYHVARAGGLADGDYVSLVERLDRRVADVERRPRGFTITPLLELDLDRDGAGVLAKDETGNVSGSHKARHLFGALLHVEILEAIGRGDGLRDRLWCVCSLLGKFLPDR